MVPLLAEQNFPGNGHQCPSLHKMSWQVIDVLDLALAVRLNSNIIYIYIFMYMYNKLGSEYPLIFDRALLKCSRSGPSLRPRFRTDQEHVHILTGSRPDGCDHAQILTLIDSAWRRVMKIGLTPASFQPFLLQQVLCCGVLLNG
jgi:hypothetical protein